MLDIYLWKVAANYGHCTRCSYYCSTVGFLPLHTEIEMGLQAVDDTCICSSLHVQGTFTYTDSHRCPLHNDTMEHDCTSKNIVPGLIVPSDGQLDTPQAVEDRCICGSLHIHGNSVNVRYYHRCPVHNDTLEHNCTHNNTVTGKTNFVQFGELPEAS